MPVIFLSQFFFFYTKDETYLKLDNIKDILAYTKKCKFPKHEELFRYINPCLKRIQEEVDAPLILEEIWDLTQKLSFLSIKNAF
jgi:hypothetical protein